MGMLRHPRTTQERRRWFADKEDIDLRPRRAPHALPQVWDDLWIRHQRSWKANRKSKWRQASLKIGISP